MLNILGCVQYTAGEDLKAGDYVTLGADGKLYKQNSKVTDKLSDEAFIAFLKKNPAYSHINIDRELVKIDNWLKKNPSRRKTRLFVMRWMDRQEIPLKPQEKLDAFGNAFGNKKLVL